jgi:acyl carrier protein
MTKEEFVQGIMEILEIEDASLVQDTTVFRELDEWDSLAALSTISMIDDEFGVTINNKDLRSVETLGELYDMVSERAK